jgi:hypothetical protein
VNKRIDHIMLGYSRFSSQKTVIIFTGGTLDIRREES